MGERAGVGAAGDGKGEVGGGGGRRWDGRMQEERRRLEGSRSGRRAEKVGKLEGGPDILPVSFLLCPSASLVIFSKLKLWSELLNYGELIKR